MNNLTDEEKFEHFFIKPSNINTADKVKKDYNNYLSPLYLLRADIDFCYKEFSSPKVTWLATMGIYAGIDLLGKFYSGKDNRFRKDKSAKEDESKDSVRFEKFLKDFLHISKKKAYWVYKHRCALMHSFGIFITHKGDLYRFMVNQRKDLPIVKIELEHKVVIISIIKLRERFEKAIKEYHERLKRESLLQQNFLRMYPDYGSIRMD